MANRVSFGNALHLLQLLALAVLSISDISAVRQTHKLMHRFCCWLALI